MKATAYQVSIMAHMLGDRNPKKWYRNMFIADERHDDFKDLKELERNGLIKRTRTPSFIDFETINFAVTEAGKDFFR